MDRNRALEQVKAKVFIGSNAAFLGCLLCGLTFRWSKECSTACVGEREFLWNPEWFDTLSPDECLGVLLHELWHVALLHGVRGKDKDHERWNAACDYRINNNLRQEGYALPDGGLWDDQYLDKEWSEEKIYDALPSGPKQQTWGTQQFSDSPSQVTLVQEAVVSAKFAGQSPGEAEDRLNQFLKPKLPWRHLFRRYLLDKLEQNWSWQRPNRRYQDIYMPALLPDEAELESIVMFLDTSGSISEEEIQRFVSEAKFVQENLNPKKLTLIQFDTRIQKIDTYNRGDRIKALDVCGFGGTYYGEVHDYILKHKPTVSIIFTDLCAEEMEPVGKNEVIWVVSYSKYSPPFGKAIYVD